MKPESKTKISRVENGQVKILHTQAIKQSVAYQTGDVLYGVEIVVSDDPVAIRKGLRRCEDIVENALGEKLPQMQKLLRGLGSQNR